MLGVASIVMGYAALVAATGWVGVAAIVLHLAVMGGWIIAVPHQPRRRA